MRSSFFVVSNSDSEVHYFFLKSSPFIFLLAFTNYSWSLARARFFCWSCSNWFCKFFKLAKLFWFILLSFSDLVKVSICSFDFDRFFSLYSSWFLRFSSSPCNACLSSLDLANSSVKVFTFYYWLPHKVFHLSRSLFSCCSFFSNDAIRGLASPFSRLSFELLRVFCSPLLSMSLSFDELRLLRLKGAALGGRGSLDGWLSSLMNLQAVLL